METNQKEQIKIAQNYILEYKKRLEAKSFSWKPLDPLYPTTKKAMREEIIILQNLISQNDIEKLKKENEKIELRTKGIIYFSNLDSF